MHLITVSNPTLSPADPLLAAGPDPAGGPTVEADVGRSLKESARDTAAQIKSKSAEVATEARDKTAEFAAERKEEVADRLGGYGRAIHESARSLEEEDPNIAWFTHRAANRLQEMADYLRDRDFASLRMDAENLARRHPAAFFGGMLAAGLTIGSLLKVSARHDHRPDEWTGHGERKIGTPEDIGPEAYPAGSAAAEI